MNEDELERRRELFTKVLPNWEARIFNVSQLTLQTKVIDTHIDIDDICNQLRWAVWQAVLSWQEDRGASLSSWIFQKINQEKGLLIEAQYNKLPRDDNGAPLYPIPIDDPDEGDSTKTQIEDSTALDKLLTFIESDWFYSAMKKIREALPSNFAKEVFNLILSEEYDSDQAIANKLKVDFARVAEVRHRIKIAFAVLTSIPLESFTQAKNASSIAETMKRKLNQEK